MADETQAESGSLSVRSGGDAIAKSGLLFPQSDDSASQEGPEPEEVTEAVEDSESDEVLLDTADDADESDEFDDEPEESEASDDDESDGDEGDTDDSDDSESPTYTVKVDGEEFEVTLDEALNGYQRQQDYTRKAMALADQRRELQDAAEEIVQKQTEYDNRLDLVEQVLQQQVPEDVDWDAVKRNNPKQYRELRDQYDENKKALDNIRAERERARREAADLLEKQREHVVEVEQDRLHAAIPEWADPEVKQEEVKEIVDTATSYGFSPKDVGDIVDHRLVLMLRDAAKWRQFQGNKKDAQAAARKSRKKGSTLKPGSPDRKTTKKDREKSKTLKAARKRLQETGNVADAAKALSGLI